MENNETTSNSPAPIAGEDSIKEIMQNFINALPRTKEEEKWPEKLSSGEQAKLRRALLSLLRKDVNDENRNSLLAPLFYLSNLFEFNINECFNEADDLNKSERWALWYYCALQLKSQHDITKNLGEALADSNYSQTRLLRLIKPKTKSFIKELISTVEIIKSKGSSISLIDIGYFILKGKNSEKKSLTVAKQFYESINQKG